MAKPAPRKPAPAKTGPGNAADAIVITGTAFHEHGGMVAETLPDGSVRTSIIFKDPDINSVDYMGIETEDGAICSISQGGKVVYTEKTENVNGKKQQERYGELFAPPTNPKDPYSARIFAVVPLSEGKIANKYSDSQIIIKGSEGTLSTAIDGKTIKDLEKIKEIMDKAQASKGIKCDKPVVLTADDLVCLAASNLGKPTNQPEFEVDNCKPVRTPKVETQQQPAAVR